MKYRDVSVEYLKSVGFEQYKPQQEPNIKDIAFMMAEGMYEVKLELDTSWIYRTPEYTTSGLPLYGSTYQDEYQYEIMYYRVRQSYIAKHIPELIGAPNPWIPGLRRRKVTRKGILISNYCGD